MTGYIRVLYLFPNEITLLEGDENAYSLTAPFFINVRADREGILNVNSSKTREGKKLALSNPISLRSSKNGSVNLNLSIFGFIPLKTMRVDILSNKNVIACGNTVGVKLKIDGILVIGISDVETDDGRKVLPVRDSGIKPGDYIVQVNSSKVNSIDELIDEIEKCRGDAIQLRFRRGKNLSTVSVRPVKSIDDNRYHIGLWVRDSTAGIGTLTFYDPQSKVFGALGHGITDIDTGELMPVEKGEILESSILGVKVGVPGQPGELKGVFIENNKLGDIDKNCEHGIYGILNDYAVNSVSKKLFPIAVRSEIKEGPAIILSNIDGKKIEEYAVEIQKVSRQSMNGSKGMIVRITDKRLLNATGGIVQGMSGSPIIQNGKIIGAVTHVLVNDPTRGYGIFIEGMLKNLTGNNQSKLEIAG
jgi:stage IV sporulation protein B